jgi:hypothetical protein
MTMYDAIGFCLALLATFVAGWAQFLHRPTRNRVDQLQKRLNGELKKEPPGIQEFQARTELLERSFREIESEWGVMYGKFQRMLKSLQMRQHREEKKEEEESQPPSDDRAAVWRRIRGR